jgi:hypothetical protein
LWAAKILAAKAPLLGTEPVAVELATAEVDFVLEEAFEVVLVVVFGLVVVVMVDVVLLDAVVGLLLVEEEVFFVVVWILVLIDVLRAAPLPFARVTVVCCVVVVLALLLVRRNPLPLDNANVVEVDTAGARLSWLLTASRAIGEALTDWMEQRRRHATPRTARLMIVEIDRDSMVASNIY